MAELTLIYWRDIPAQVIARAGRNSAKAQLAARFTEAIDSAAMRAGLTNSDAYLAEWRRGDPTPCADDLDAAVDAAVDALDRDYPPARLKALIDNGGKEGGA
ncbi:MAG TPA: virulence factor [Methylomirabilota bacterium]|nr:virulence factor [Methylomirabilota bacterium]